MTSKPSSSAAIGRSSEPSSSAAIGRSSNWHSALDEFEARLHAQSHALDAGGDPTVTPFVPPVMTVPLPSELVSRATGLVQRCRDIEMTLANALERAGAALERAAAAPVSAGADQQPVYFDSRV